MNAASLCLSYSPGIPNKETQYNPLGASQSGSLPHRDVQVDLMNSSTAPPLPPPCFSLLPQLSWQLLPKPPPPPHFLLSFLLIFFQWTQKCRPHRNEGVLNSSSPLMPVPSCLHSSIKRLPSSARNLLVVPDLLWFDLFSACLCNSLKPGFPSSEQNADLFGKSIISSVFSCSTS